MPPGMRVGPTDVADEKVGLGEVRLQPGGVDDLWELAHRTSVSSNSAATAGRSFSRATHAESTGNRSRSTPRLERARGNPRRQPMTAKPNSRPLRKGCDSSAR